MISQGKGFGEKKLVIKSNFSSKSHPLTKIAKKGSSDYKTLIRFIEEHWELLSAQAWKGYLEQGRGAVHILLGTGGWEALGAPRRKKRKVFLMN